MPTEWSLHTVIVWLLVGACLAGGWVFGSWLMRGIVNILDWIGRKLSGK